MSGDSSSSSNDSLLHPQPSSVLLWLDCITWKQTSVVVTSVSNILLLLPLCILVLYHGLQQWRLQLSSSSSSSSAPTSHFDVFTYHMVIMQLLSVFGSILCCCSIYWKDFKMFKVWYCLYCFIWYGQTFFHVLTCVDRYLAVVHPITYLSLKKERGVRIRNVCMGCVWLFSLGGVALAATDNSSLIVDVCLLVSSVIIISYCSLSVLCVLIRPGPGEQGRDRGRVDQSKKRAFYTIVAILGVLLLRCVWNLLWSVQDILNVKLSKCSWVISEVWTNFPSSLVLPLMFAHRAGTPACCKTMR